MKSMSFTNLTVMLTTLIAASSNSTVLAADPPVDPPVVQVLATDPTALEGASTGAFTFIRNRGTNADLSVNYLLKGTASNGVDYVLLPGAATIPAGYLAADILVQPIVDPMNHGNKTVMLNLQTNLAYQLGERRSATVTIVDDIYNNLPPVVTLVRPTNGTVFSAPANINLEAEASDQDDEVQSVSFYANDRFLGRDEHSPFSLVWSNAPAGEYTLFARAVDPFGKSTLSGPVHIRVVQTNLPPRVSIVTPANGSVFGLPANVNVLVEAADPDDAVTQVKIYGDEHLLGTFTSGPYSLTWSNVPPGQHVIVARAIDAVGLSAYAVAHFSVSNAPPIVRLTAPANRANFPVLANIALEAEASDPDDAVVRVSFWANERLLGVVTNTPYSLIWSNAPPGIFALTARATDQFGLRGYSRPVLISVSGPAD